MRKSMSCANCPLKGTPPCGDKMDAFNILRFGLLLRMGLLNHSSLSSSFTSTPNHPKWILGKAKGGIDKIKNLFEI